jgi:hypothetical protein
MDIAVVETGNGGDLVKAGNDLAQQSGWGNMPYLAMFGGNVEQSTPMTRVATEQAKDWWGNNLLFAQDQSVQFNSETERTLQNVPLTSSGRILIQQAVEKDLEFMKSFAIIKVRVTIIGLDTVEIFVAVAQPSNLNGRVPDQYKGYIFIWDATAKELGDFRIQDFNDDFLV